MNSISPSSFPMESGAYKYGAVAQEGHIEARLQELRDQVLPQGIGQLQAKQENVKQIIAYCTHSYINSPKAEKEAVYEKAKQYTTDALQTIAGLVRQVTDEFCELMTLQAHQLERLGLQMESLRLDTTHLRTKAGREGLLAFTSARSDPRQAQRVQKLEGAQVPEEARPALDYRRLSHIDFSVYDQVGITLGGGAQHPPKMGGGLAAVQQDSFPMMTPPKLSGLPNEPQAPVSFAPPPPPAAMAPPPPGAAPPPPPPAMGVGHVPPPPRRESSMLATPPPPPPPAAAKASPPPPPAGRAPPMGTPPPPPPAGRVPSGPLSMGTPPPPPPAGRAPSGPLSMGTPPPPLPSQVGAGPPPRGHPPPPMGAAVPPPPSPPKPPPAAVAPPPPPGPPAPPPPGPPKPKPSKGGSRKPIGGGGGGGGRGALLSSIEGFTKGGLKKVETLDRSAPAIPGGGGGGGGGGAAGSPTAGRGRGAPMSMADEMAARLARRRVG